MTEVEIKKELQEQGVAEVHRVMVKRDTDKVPTNTPFLTFNVPEMPKEIMVGSQKVKVAMFALKPVVLLHLQQVWPHARCKVAAKCQWCGKDKHEGQCEGPKLALIAMVPTPHQRLVWQEEKEIQYVCIEKCVSFLEATQLVETKMPTVVSGRKSYATAVSTRKEVKSVE